MVPGGSTSISNINGQGAVIDPRRVKKHSKTEARTTPLTTIEEALQGEPSWRHSQILRQIAQGERSAAEPDKTILRLHRPEPIAVGTLFAQGVTEGDSVYHPGNLEYRFHKEGDQDGRYKAGAIAHLKDINPGMEVNPSTFLMNLDRPLTLRENGRNPIRDLLEDPNAISDHFIGKQAESLAYHAIDAYENQKSIRDSSGQIKLSAGDLSTILERARSARRHYLNSAPADMAA
jgi:hypothetical protein